MQDRVEPKYMSDANMIDERYNYQYIHNIFADFIKASLDWFVSLYPRFQWTVVGTYDKGVEYINKQIELGRNPDKPNVPALILNPTGEFGLDDAGSGARQIYYRFPNLAPGLINRMYDPIYEDNDVKLTVGFTRLKGEFELICLLPSFYEYFDLRILFLQMFGGDNRPIFPQWINSFLILPREIYEYEYNNTITGIPHRLDWEKSNVSEILIKTTNVNEMVVPVKMRPRYMITSMTDASTKYGADKLADWRLSVNIEYQIEMPSMLMLITNHLVENMIMEIKYGLNYSNYDLFDTEIQGNISLIKTHWIPVVDSTSEDYFQVVLPDSPETIENKDYVLNNTYIHIITQEEIDSSSVIMIDLEEAITDIDSVLVLSTYGYLTYGDHYLISADGLHLSIKNTIVKAVVGQVFKILVYSLIGSS